MTRAELAERLDQLILEAQEELETGEIWQELAFAIDNLLAEN